MSSISKLDNLVSQRIKHLKYYYYLLQIFLVWSHVRANDCAFDAVSEQLHDSILLRA